MELAKQSLEITTLEVNIESEISARLHNKDVLIEAAKEFTDPNFCVCFIKMALQELGVKHVDDRITILSTFKEIIRVHPNPLILIAMMEKAIKQLEKEPKEE